MPDGRITTRQKQRVAERAGHCCEYCWSQARFTMDPFSVEHIIPISRGGDNSLNNLALACQGCNNHKYNKVQAEDPISGQVAPLHHPRRNHWENHFVWSSDFTLIIGLTPIGRATVDLLQLNREGLTNLRRVLYDIGEHPPGRNYRR
jgi:hypothetical protein